MFILQGWLVPFWIANFVVVKMACVETEPYAFKKYLSFFLTPFSLPLGQDTTFTVPIPDITFICLPKSIIRKISLLVSAIFNHVLLVPFFD